MLFKIFQCISRIFFRNFPTSLAIFPELRIENHCGENLKKKIPVGPTCQQLCLFVLPLNGRAGRLCLFLLPVAHAPESKPLVRSHPLAKTGATLPQHHSRCRSWGPAVPRAPLRRRLLRACPCRASTPAGAPSLQSSYR